MCWSHYDEATRPLAHDVSGAGGTWSVSAVKTGSAATIANFNITPGSASLTVPAGGTATLGVTVDAVVAAAPGNYEGKVVLTNGAQACNVFWQVGSSATLGTGSSFRGTIIALTSITLTTGANLSGRALARNGAVTTDTNTITPCGPGISDIPVLSGGLLLLLAAAIAAIALTVLRQ